MNTRILRVIAPCMIFATLICFSVRLNANNTFQIIHAGHLLLVSVDSNRSAHLNILQEQSVILKGDEIDAVHDGYVLPEDLDITPSSETVIINLRDKYVMPGLIDGHVHLTATPVGSRMLDRVVYSDADRAIIGAAAARRTLEAGFTTVRDLGARGVDAIYALRDGIQRGYIPGPRLLVSGQTITPTGGHMDKSTGYRPEFHELLTSDGVCDGADDCRHAVRSQIRNSADAIKVTATGGVLSAASSGVGMQFTEEELSAVISTSHSLGRRVAAHAHGVDGINAALTAGADSIEHGTFLDEESIRLFKKSGAYLVPTLMAGEAVSNWANDPHSTLPAEQIPKAALVGKRMIISATKAYRAGIPIAFGTDSGVVPNGQNCREFELLTMAGLTSQDAILSSLVNAAENLGVADQVGRIAMGYRADIIALDENPLIDVNSLCHPVFVMKGGIRYATDSVFSDPL